MHPANSERLTSVAGWRTSIHRLDKRGHIVCLWRFKYLCRDLRRARDSASASGCQGLGLKYKRESAPTAIEPTSPENAQGRAAALSDLNPRQSHVFLLYLPAHLPRAPLVCPDIIICYCRLASPSRPRFIAPCFAWLRPAPSSPGARMCARRGINTTSFSAFRMGLRNEG